MKATELIAQLQTSIEKHGDLETYVRDIDGDGKFTRWVTPIFMVGGEFCDREHDSPINGFLIA